MAFVNLPPNLQDIFYSITDRIAKLETGPNQAMYTAVSAQASAQSAQSAATAASLQAASAQASAIIAQSQAVTAQATANTAYLAANVASAQAITANNTANAAASQATIAQSQATIASSQATLAQTSANSKNKILYGTSATPPAGTYQNGDIYYIYDLSNRIKGNLQYNGTSWVTAPFTAGSFTALDAGAITTGTLSSITISAGSGANAFYVSSSGVMSAQGAYIKGNITADSGTFNGQVNASSGYFGSVTNGWQINSGGIAGLGSGYISGGTIQGANFNNGNGTFYVNSAGALTASNATIQGTINATGGFFGANASNGWVISSTGITGLGSTTITGGQIVGTSFNNGSGTFVVTSSGALTASSANITGTINATSGSFTGTLTSSNGTIGGWNLSSNLLYTGTLASPNQYLNASGGALFTGTTTCSALGVNTNLTIGGTLTTGSTANFNGFLYNSGHTTTGSAANAYLNSTTGLLARSTASSQRYKYDIVNLTDVAELAPEKLYDLPVRAFRFNDGYIPDTDDRAGMLVPGFIAEEVDAIYPIGTDYNAGQVETWNDRMIVPAMLALIQDQNKRIKALEAQLPTLNP